MYSVTSILATLIIIFALIGKGSDEIESTTRKMDTAAGAYNAAVALFVST